jgi:hypothetical protein
MHGLWASFYYLHHQGLHFVLLTSISGYLDVFQREWLIQLLLIAGHVLVTIGVGNSADADLIFRVGSFEQAFADVEAKVINRANIAITFLTTFVAILHRFYLLLSVDRKLLDHSLINFQLWLDALSWLVDFQSIGLASFAHLRTFTLLTFIHGQLLFQFKITLSKMTVFYHLVASWPSFRSSIFGIDLSLRCASCLVQERLLHCIVLEHRHVAIDLTLLLRAALHMILINGNFAQIQIQFLLRLLRGRSDV